MQTNVLNVLRWLCRLTASLILFQTLYFKFTGHPESMMLFQMLGVEPYGRVVLGIVELIVGILILLPKTSVLGAIMGIGTMLGAIATHLFIIGINYAGDGGVLFWMAVVVLISCLFICFISKKEIFVYVNKFLPKKSI